MVDPSALPRLGGAGGPGREANIGFLVGWRWLAVEGSLWMDLLVRWNGRFHFVNEPVEEAFALGGLLQIDVKIGKVFWLRKREFIGSTNYVCILKNEI